MGRARRADALHAPGRRPDPHRSRPHHDRLDRGAARRPHRRRLHLRDTVPLPAGTRPGADRHGRPAGPRTGGAEPARRTARPRSCGPLRIGVGRTLRPCRRLGHAGPRGGRRPERRLGLHAGPGRPAPAARRGRVCGTLHGPRRAGGPLRRPRRRVHADRAGPRRSVLPPGAGCPGGGPRMGHHRRHRRLRRGRTAGHRRPAPPAPAPPPPARPVRPHARGADRAAGDPAARGRRARAG